MSQFIIISKGFKVDVRPEQLMESRRGSEMDSRPTRPMSRSALRDTYRVNYAAALCHHQYSSYVCLAVSTPVVLYFRNADDEPHQIVVAGMNIEHKTYSFNVSKYSLR